MIGMWAPSTKQPTDSEMSLKRSSTLPSFSIRDLEGSGTHGR